MRRETKTVNDGRWAKAISTLALVAAGAAFFLSSSLDAGTGAWSSEKSEVISRPAEALAACDRQRTQCPPAKPETPMQTIRLISTDAGAPSQITTPIAPVPIASPSLNTAVLTTSNIATALSPAPQPNAEKPKEMGPRESRAKTARASKDVDPAGASERALGYGREGRAVRRALEEFDGRGVKAPAAPRDYSHVRDERIP